MSRHPDYPKLTLVYGDEWRGLPLIEGQAPFGERYLQVNLNVMRSAIERHRRSFVILFVLRLPYGYAMSAVGLIGRFMKSLRAQVSADIHARRRSTGRALQTNVDCIWARERSSSDNYHFHVALFLNRDVYKSVGNYSLSEYVGFNDFYTPGRARATSLHHRLTRAWASALALTEAQGVGLVDYPRNAEFHLDAHAMRFLFDYCALFRRLSYMAKIRTKDFGGGADCYGSSRVVEGSRYFSEYDSF